MLLGSPTRILKGNSFLNRKSAIKEKQKMNIYHNSWNSKLSIQSISRISNLGIRSISRNPKMGSRSISQNGKLGSCSFSRIHITFNQPYVDESCQANPSTQFWSCEGTLYYWYGLIRTLSVSGWQSLSSSLSLPSLELSIWQKISTKYVMIDNLTNYLSHGIFCTDMLEQLYIYCTSFVMELLPYK